MAGPFKQDLKTILTLLAAGLDPEQGISMYMSALGDKRERQDRREDLRRFMVTDAMPTLQQGGDWSQARATLNALGDAYGVGPNLLRKTKQDVLQDFYGGDREGESVFAPTAEDPGWDESDEQLLAEFVAQGEGAGYGRAEIRERLKAMLRDTWGDEVVDKYQNVIDMNINRFYTGKGEAGTTGSAVPVEDAWLKSYDQPEPGGPPRPTTTGLQALASQEGTPAQAPSPEAVRPLPQHVFHSLNDLAVRVPDIAADTLGAVPGALRGLADITNPINWLYGR